MTSSDKNVISIFGVEDSEVEDELWWFQKTRGELEYGRGGVSAEALSERVDAFLGQMAGVFRKVPKIIGEFQIDSVTLSVEVSATGRVSLLGNGGEASGSGGLTFELKRVKPDKSA